MVEFVNFIGRGKSDSNRNFSSLPQPQNEFYAGEELKANTTNLYFFERFEMRKMRGLIKEKSVSDGLKDIAAKLKS